MTNHKSCNKAAISTKKFQLEPIWAHIRYTRRTYTHSDVAVVKMAIEPRNLRIKVTGIGRMMSTEPNPPNPKSPLTLIYMTMKWPNFKTVTKLFETFLHSVVWLMFVGINVRGFDIKITVWKIKLFTDLCNFCNILIHS